jgi:hypothetical protein
LLFVSCTEASSLGKKKIVINYALSGSGMPQIIQNWGIVAEGNRLINEQLNYNREELAARVMANTTQFIITQCGVYHAVIQYIINNNIHFCGLLCLREITLCVALSGIGSLLLEDRTIAHFTFKITLQVNDTRLAMDHWISLGWPSTYFAGPCPDP